jgi:hypothetical protein
MTSSDYDDWFFRGHDEDTYVPPLPDGIYEDIKFNGEIVNIVMKNGFKRLYWSDEDGEIVANFHWKDLSNESIDLINSILSDMSYDYWAKQ